MSFKPRKNINSMQIKKNIDGVDLSGLEPEFLHSKRNVLPVELQKKPEVTRNRTLINGLKGRCFATKL